MARLSRLDPTEFRAPREPSCRFGVEAPAHVRADSASLEIRERLALLVRRFTLHALRLEAAGY